MTLLQMLSSGKKTLKYLLNSFLALFTLFTFATCTKKVPLSPARSIAGTWKSLVKVNINDLTNCNDNNIYVYATYPAYITFTITAVTDNTVTVDVYLSAISGKNDDCGENPPVEYTNPVTYSGQISSSQLTLTDNVYAKNSTGHIVFGAFDIGDFSFTTDLMTGKIFWLQYFSALDAIGWETEQISLTKQ